jgi:hypothetical protein
MRLWSLHPSYLDRQGLTGAWREALLAQAVLAGRTRGYRAHPQLERFRAQAAPLDAIAAFLRGLADEAEARGYRFDRTRIGEAPGEVLALEVTRGQVEFEAAHLRAKLVARSPVHGAALEAELAAPRVHPLFRVVPGPVAPWERP